MWSITVSLVFHVSVRLTAASSSGKSVTQTVTRCSAPAELDAAGGLRRDLGASEPAVQDRFSGLAGLGIGATGGLAPRHQQQHSAPATNGSAVLRSETGEAPTRTDPARSAADRWFFIVAQSLSSQS